MKSQVSLVIASVIFMCLPLGPFRLKEWSLLYSIDQFCWKMVQFLFVYVDPAKFIPCQLWSFFNLLSWCFAHRIIKPFRKWRQAYLYFARTVAKFWSEKKKLTIWKNFVPFEIFRTLGVDSRLYWWAHRINDYLISEKYYRQTTKVRNAR